MPVTVAGRRRSPRGSSVQIGPAINGTALRDATGQVDFNDFVNQVEYANAATALNTEMKADVLQGLDPQSLVGKKVTVVGATAPLNPEVITVTPVSIEAGPVTTGDHEMRRPGPVMAAREVTKTYGGTHALRGVSLGVAAGPRHRAVRRERRRQVHPDEDPRRHRDAHHRPGRARRRDVVEFASPRQAADHGVVIIHQELSLCPNLSIQDNLFLAREARGRLRQRQPQRSARRRPRRCCSGSRRTLDPDTLVGDLRIGQQQLVEIARALLQNARVLIMDEPTSALSMTEVDVLFRVIRELTAQGVAVIYISHHLEESLEIADDVAVLRDGQLVATAAADEVDLAWVVQHMVGPRPGLAVPQAATPPSARSRCRSNACQVADPANPHRLAVDGIDLEIRAGEIVGVYGLMASGRTELLEAIAGRLPVASGTVTFAGDRLHRRVRARADPPRASPWCPRTGSATGWSRRCRSARTSP